MLVIKVSGNELDNAHFLEELAKVIAHFPRYPVVVHGGGKGTSALAARLGVRSRFVDGLRVTDEETLDVVVMGLVGTASTRLVLALVNAGVPALGMSGVDAGLITVEKLVHAGGDLGWVGKPVAVNAGRLDALLNAGFVPCLAPVSLGADGRLYNVNADHVAQAVAAALEAEALVFLTNVPGVLADGELCAQLTPAEVEQLIQQGTITDGMIPKVRSACRAVGAGVRVVVITDLAGLRAWARGEPAGTRVVAE
ncbi:MAG: acetylglutamate kinase [Ardenticatenia bacterium]|nr:acetylglutamate kinase [Ardenticatenia bacterium]